MSEHLLPFQEELQMKYYTYAHYTADTKELFYIGKGTTSKDFPFKRAFSEGGRNYLWKHKVKKHSGFLCEILASWKTEKEAFEHEIFLISVFAGKLVNLTLGGEGGLGRICTDEERLAKSLRLKGIKFSEEHINKINKNPEKIKKTADKHRGMKRSEQAKQNMSDSRKGCKANNKGQKCYYNIELNKRIYLNADDPIPEGYVDKVPNLNKNKIWIHNPTTNERTFHQKDQTLPEGYILGRGKRN